MRPTKSTASKTYKGNMADGVDVMHDLTYIYSGRFSFASCYTQRLSPLNRLESCSMISENFTHVFAGPTLCTSECPIHREWGRAAELL